MRLKYMFEITNLDDRMIAVPVGEGANDFHGVIKLNETAAFIFKLLKDDTTENAILDVMEKEFNAPRDVLAADVHKYVVDFMEKGLLA